MRKCDFSSNCKKFLNNNCDDNFCVREFKLNYYYDNSLLPDTAKRPFNLYIDSDGRDLEAFKQLKEVEKNIISFVENGCNLYLYSNICGNGKTAWATRLTQAYINKAWIKRPMEPIVLFIHVPTFLLALKDNISQKNNYVEHIRKYVKEADLVVWDEVATKAVTQYEHEHLLSMINERINSKLSNIYTSNLYGEELKNLIGDRLYSRIINTSTNIQLIGRDKRGLS